VCHVCIVYDNADAGPPPPRFSLSARAPNPSSLWARRASARLTRAASDVMLRTCRVFRVCVCGVQCAPARSLPGLGSFWTYLGMALASLLAGLLAFVSVKGGACTCAH
jgi:hypothetical protein